jgi:N-acyl-D-amino-acid deacylase
VGRGKAYRKEDLPAGAARIVRPAMGVQGVWINGVRVVDEGRVNTSRTPGQVLREFSSAGS